MQDYNTGATWQGGREAEMGNNYTPVRKHKISLLSGSGEGGGNAVQGAGGKGE